MPTLHLRGVPSELLQRLRAGAKDLSLDAYALQMIERGLNDIDARRRAGLARVAQLTPEQQRDQARRAGLASGRSRAAPRE